MFLHLERIEIMKKNGPEMRQEYNFLVTFPHAPPPTCNSNVASQPGHQIVSGQLQTVVKGYYTLNASK